MTTIKIEISNTPDPLIAYFKDKIITHIEYQKIPYTITPYIEGDGYNIYHDDLTININYKELFIMIYGQEIILDITGKETHYNLADPNNVLPQVITKMKEFIQKHTND